MPLYSADQIVGKTLYAKTAVPIKRLPSDKATVVYTGKPGAIVGTVYSWLAPNPAEGRSQLYWMFYDNNNRAYYAEHAEGRFDLDALKESGALTVKEQAKAEAKANEGVKDFIERLFKWGMIVGGVFVIGKAVVQRGSNRK